MLYKFRLSLKLKLTRNRTESRSKDEEDQQSTNVVEQEQNDVELKPIPAGPSKAESDEELPAEHFRPPLKRRSSSVYSTDSLWSSDCSEYADIWSRQIEESRIAGLEIVAWWQSVYDLQ
ncbi:hypothetical protein AC578_8300 [Pseudocercospora eumusae]|uniref:Uncharacterized protein n=1 Tax=Pseudocercospora eumusae TaxID=321146 RepID=A0A139GYY4_9PEZI|nr:hypothetical protein AC578_8300 [Pseudocercospora eumusae]